MPFKDITDNPNNLKKTTRQIVLEPMDGKVTSTKGAVDNRLFKGTNKLHAVMDDQTCLWHMRYDSGVLPGALQQQFTSFTKLITFVTEYYKRRNIRIVEVID